MSLQLDDLRFSMGDLLPVVVQHHRSGQVLMVGFANREAVRRTLDTGHAWFFSRSAAGAVGKRRDQRPLPGRQGPCAWTATQMR